MINLRYTNKAKTRKYLPCYTGQMNHYAESLPLSENHELLTRYSSLISQLLVNRGIHTIKDAKTFITPQYEDNHDPFLMYNLKQATERIHTAITKNQKITIYADYDADGIPGAVVLASLLDVIKFSNYNIYIPHRHDEGFGVHVDALEKIKSDGTKLVITIDVGITGHDATNWCKEHNLELIVTDHHLPLQDDDGNEYLPDTLVVNPKQSGCSYPEPMLCGTGVIFKVVQGFLNRYRDTYNVPEGYEKWMLDMVGIATISDMVPLLGENRTFAYYGLKVIKKTKRIGLKKLIWDAGISIDHLNEEDIGFGISPKLNAASRMSHPEEALAVLRAQNDIQATMAVKHLISLNNNRKKLVAQTTKKAYGKLANRTLGDVIVVGSPDWQAGVLGLVASKIVERYQKRVFVWSEEGGEIKGSCRSYNGTHLVDLMNATEPDTFIQFGGHAEAGGFSCAKKEIHFLEERLNTAFATLPKNNHDAETLVIDAEINLDDINDELYHQIEQLAPFGVGNPKPLFMFKNVTPITVNQFGKTKEHVEIYFSQSNGQHVRAIAFFKTPNDFEKVPQLGIAINLLAHLEHSVFMGKHELRLKIVDII